MVTKDELGEWVVEALATLGGSGSVTDVSKLIWENHGEQIESSGDMFYTWQYDVRWAAHQLRRLGTIRPVERGVKKWVLSS